jgi:hypothetical protein
MTPWSARPRDEANLFNPAFCGAMLHQAIKGYASVSTTGMPFPVIFLVLPLILHKATREKLPKRLGALNGLASWTANFPESKIGFDHRLSVMSPITRETLLFLFRAGAIEIVAKSNLVPIARKIKDGRSLAEESDEIAECFSAALFVGKWLANAGTPQSVYALMGVRP